MTTLLSIASHFCIGCFYAICAFIVLVIFAGVFRFLGEALRPKHEGTRFLQLFVRYFQWMEYKGKDLYIRMHKNKKEGVNEDKNWWD